MVIMSNTIHSGTYLHNIDNRSDNSSIGSLSSFNRNEIPAKNDKDMTLRKITTKSTGTTTRQPLTMKDGLQQAQERRNQRILTALQHRSSQSSRQ